MSPLAVVALGGNALLRRGEPAEASHQQANVRAAAQAIAALHGSHRLVVTHGNGPQVGLLALQAEAYTDVKPYPLDVLGAETEGMIGYLLDQALLNELPAGSRVATLLTQTRGRPGRPGVRRSVEAHRPGVRAGGRGAAGPRARLDSPP